MKRLALASAALACLLASGVARAEPDEVPEWRPRRDVRIGTADYFVAGGAAAVVIGAIAVPPSNTRWHGGVWFDEDVRDFLRVRSQAGRYAVRDASDVGVSLASTWPFL